MYTFKFLPTSYEGILPCHTSAAVADHLNQAAVDHPYHM